MPKKTVFLLRVIAGRYIPKNPGPQISRVEPGPLFPLRFVKRANPFGQGGEGPDSVCISEVPALEHRP